MKRAKSYYLSIIWGVLFSQMSLIAFAQNDNVSYKHENTLGFIDHSDNKKEKAVMVAIGAANVLDTYLSAEQYKGTEFRIIAENRSKISPKRLSHLLSHHGCFTSLDNRAGNSNEISGVYNFQYFIYYHWRIAHHWSVQTGGGIDAQLGVLYNTRNTNNPVQVDASLQLSPSSSITYKNIINKRFFQIRYAASFPLAGLMFSPNYGQSYYEIFSKDNYDHNVVPTTIFSTPSLQHSLTFDYQLFKNKPDSKIRIGYLGDLRQSKVNNIKRHHYAHMLLIGWVHNI